MLTPRQYLRQLKRQKEDETILKLLELSNLTETEYWLMYYAFVKGRMVENICRKLNIQKTKYHTMLNEALIKVEFTINKLDKIRSL